jgi:GDP-mannose 6-dehydrogenase
VPGTVPSARRTCHHPLILVMSDAATPRAVSTLAQGEPQRGTTATRDARGGVRATRIGVFGLGYVGSVSAACLAMRGHEVVGVDVNEQKANLLSAGRSPVVEPGLDELISTAVQERRLRAITDAATAVQATNLSLVCVGTPSAADGGPATEALERVCEDIGHALAAVEERHTVVFRSTMLPGTCEGLLTPILEHTSGLRAGDDFGVCVNPEFLREGNGILDFTDPAKTVIGQLDDASGDPLAALYEDFPGALFRAPIKVAEFAKYVDNAFHALKIGFANEIGALCADLGVDSHRVMEIFRADRKLNISDAYLTPGFSFGGSCLPKDLRALIHHARGARVYTPIVESVLASNDEHFRRTLDLVTRNGRRRVGLFGLAFKHGTDELRESPFVELAERLIGKGFDLRIYDPAVNPSRLTGANRDYVDVHLPHIRDLLSDSPDDVLRHADICIAASRDERIVEAMDGADGQMIVDLVRLPNSEDLRRRAEYFGVAW